MLSDPRIGSVEMTFRVGTRDGTVVVVDETDLDLITAYLALRGYPPISVEVVDAPTSDLRDALCELQSRTGR
jgi:hypothetical protein